MLRRLPTLLAAAALLVVSTAQSAEPDAEAIAFFESKIRPVLVAHCYECHAAEAQPLHAGLTVDTRAGLLAGGDSGPAIVPGKPEESLLLAALKYEDYEMPPKGKLPQAVIDDFTQWIAMGAPDPRDGEKVARPSGVSLEEGRQFWAFQPIHKPELPSIQDAAWPRNEIDHFILAQLEAHELTPAAAADRETLLRRAYIDLIGLPPTPAEMDAFLADKSDEAFARVIDRLLASPQFGERWGRHWLDVARFAESSGGGRAILYKNAWRYRDYVIQAFNEDKPFDQFVREQIAGDLLPYETPEQQAEQLTATGFLTLGPTNFELQDKELLQLDVIDEQLDTIGRAFLGVTIGCARCHDHKFDPIPARDYYALAGIFRNTKSFLPGNVARFIERPLPVDEETGLALEQYDAQRKELDQQLKAVTSEQRRLKQALDKVRQPLPGLVLDNHQGKLQGEWQASTFTPRFLGEDYFHDMNTGKGEKAIAFVPQLSMSGRYEIRLAYTSAVNRDPRVPVTIRSVDGEQTVYVDQTQPPPLEGHFISLGTFHLEAGDACVTISNAGTKRHVVVDGVQLVSLDHQEPPNPVDTEKIKQLEQELAAVDTEQKRLAAEQKKLTAQAPPRPLAISLEEEPTARDWHLHIRGGVRNLGEVVPRGFLSVVSLSEALEFSDDESGRRQLAQWITHPEHPLTARVISNRVWQHLFGQGLVRTPDNFGAMGERPSHPELLDWLAVRLIEQRWSLKSLIREIMLSRTYQMSSQRDGRAKQLDPENRWLAAQSRRRLDAEAIRDTLLYVSGQLDPTTGGLTMGATLTSEFNYTFDTNVRSVYVPVFRNAQLDVLEVFDAANSNLVVGKRTVSTLPTQALTLMNSPFVIEQAQHAARQLLVEGLSSDETRLAHACRQTLGRHATAEERVLFENYLKQQPQADREAAWAAIYQALFACLDFRYLD